MHFLTQASLSVSSTASSDSLPIDCQQMSKVSFQVVQTADPVDWDATLQISNDGDNWIDTTETVNIIAAANVLLEYIDLPVRWVRLRLVKTDGDLTDLRVTFNGKF